MRHSIIIVFSTITLWATSAIAQEETTLFNYWKYYSDAENSLYKQLSSIAFEQLESRKAEVNNLKTLEDWQKRQSVVRRKLLEIMGPFPERTPLNAQVTGVLNRDGYRVEKLIYESMPGYYVTAALFIPDNIKGKAPAILNAIGHSPQSFRRDVYQNFIINLVKKGFVVFAYDQIGQGERVQYYDEKTGKSRFRTTTEHSFPGGQCFISGYSPSRYFIWDGIRAIDFLLTRKEVDPDRIGMTGLSGGGTSTAFVGAIDDRILATAPTCYITNYKNLFLSEGPQDAEQNIFNFLKEGLDHADLIELRAPKPTLIVGTTRDFFSIQGLRETYLEAKSAYQAFGKEDFLQKSEANYRHSFTKKNNEATYAFFQKYLNNPGDSTEEEVDIVPEEDLQVTKTGQLFTSVNGETMHSLNKKVVEKQLSSLENSRMNIEEHLSNVPDAAIKLSGFSYPNKFGAGIFSGRYIKEKYKLEKYLLPGSGDYMLPLAMFIPVENNKNEVVLILHEKGKDYAANNDSITKQLVANGYTVLLGDLPGIGELGPGYFKGDAYIDNVSYNLWFAGILTGKSIVGIRAEDIVRMVNFIKTTLPDNKSISAISVGVLGSELLHAATFEKDIQNVCLMQPFLSYADIAMTHDYKPSFIHSIVAGAIEEYDLPDLMAGLCPRNLLIINPLSGDGLIANDSEVRESIKFPHAVYSSKNVSENLGIFDGDNNEEILVQVLEWID